MLYCQFGLHDFLQMKYGYKNLWTGAQLLAMEGVGICELLKDTRGEKELDMCMSANNGFAAKLMNTLINSFTH